MQEYEQSQFHPWKQKKPMAAGVGARLGLFGSAIGCGALVPGVGWTVAGVAITAGLIKDEDVLSADEEMKRTHKLLI